MWQRSERLIPEGDYQRSPLGYGEPILLIETTNGIATGEQGLQNMDSGRQLGVRETVDFLNSKTRLLENDL